VRRINPSFRREPTPLAKVIDALEQHDFAVHRSGQGCYMAQCPCHDDRIASLSIGENEVDGNGLIFCHAGCPTIDILAALHLTWADLFVPKPTNRRSQIVKVYDYVDAEWKPLYRACRTDGKPRFFLQRPNGNGAWVNGAEGIPRVLYRYPEIIEAVTGGETIYVAEGEKDVDALRARGFRATCNVTGAGKWRREYTEALHGATDVIVICDRDKAGWDHGWHIADQLEGRVGHLRVVEAAQGNDVSDHFAAGFTVEDLVDSHRPTTDEPRIRVTPNLEELLDSSEPEYDWKVPDLFETGDRAYVTGKEGYGKSTLLRQIGIGAALGLNTLSLNPLTQRHPPLRVLLVDLENSPNQLRREFRKQLQPVDVDELAEMRRRFFVQSRVEGLVLDDGQDQTGDRAWLVEIIEQTEPDMVILGPMYKLIEGDPWDERPNRDLAKWLDHLRGAYRFVLLLEGHTPHDGDRPYGWSGWKRWPEFGMHLSPDGRLKPFRAMRDERPWPTQLRRGDKHEWLWIPTSGDWQPAMSKVEEQIGLCERDVLRCLHEVKRPYSREQIIEWLGLRRSDVLAAIARLREHHMILVVTEQRERNNGRSYSAEVFTLNPEFSQ
jgi:hypothetical protein